MKHLRRFLYLGFVLNLAWEIFQIRFYVPLSGLMPLWLWILLASLIDVCILFLFYFLMQQIFKNQNWILGINARKIFVLMMLGAVASLINEKIGLGLYAWQYAVAMPIIPVFRTGLLPFLQMAVLPSVTFFIINLSYEQSNQTI